MSTASRQPRSPCPPASHTPPVIFDADHVCGRAAEQGLSVQECPQPPPGPTSHAGGAGTGAPTDRSRSLAIGRAVRGSRPDKCVDHCPCLPVFLSWLHFRQPRRQEPHVAAHSSDHRIGSGLRLRDRRPSVGARHPLSRHSLANSARQSDSTGSDWTAAKRDLTIFTLVRGQLGLVFEMRPQQDSNLRTRLRRPFATRQLHRSDLQRRVLPPRAGLRSIASLSRHAHRQATAVQTAQVSACGGQIRPRGSSGSCPAQSSFGWCDQAATRGWASAC
jgi:hypothetical protein